MSIEYVWKIIPKETPVVELKCNRCHHNRFICSDKFRINSNKKLSDVWLIYNCFHCDNTWNMNILTRKNMSHMNQNLFHGFQENNRDLAWQYAFNKSIAKNNKVKLSNHIDFEIVDQHGNYHHSTEDVISISMISEYELSITIKKVLQQKLNLSSNEILRLHQEEVLMNVDLSKKIGLDCKILINLKKLKSHC